jgi:hypothetical protein
MKRSDVHGKSSGEPVAEISGISLKSQRGDENE